MTDRNVQYPYRFHVRPVPGTDDICEIIPAPGTVYKDGTFWNKQNVLKDATAALYGKTADAVPDDIFAAIRPLITAAKDAVKIRSISFTGTGSTNKIYIGFKPIFLFLMPSASESTDYDSYTIYFGAGSTINSLSGRSGYPPSFSFDRGSMDATYVTLKYAKSGIPFVGFAIG